MATHDFPWLPPHKMTSPYDNDAITEREKHDADNDEDFPDER